MIDFVPVGKFFPRCQKILPLVYDDSLSYYEVLCKVSNKLNVLIDDVNAFMDWATKHEADYDALVKRVTAVENEIDNFEKEITELFEQLKREQEEAFAEQTARLDARLAEMQREVDAVIRELRNEFTLLKREVEQDIATMKVEIAREVARLSNLIDANNQYIFEYVQRTLQEFLDNFPDLADTPVYNPVRGGTTSLQTALNDLYSVACVNGITAEQFDSLGLTAEEFDALGITAKEFDQNGYIALGYHDDKYYMLNPFTGEWSLIKDVVTKLSQFHMVGLTAEEFDALDLSAEDFDATDITAFNFDWFGKEILTA